MPKTSTTKKAVKPPYVAKLKQQGRIAIWRVDGAYIRTHIDEEFTNYGHPLTESYIPKGEFWIDDAVKPDELSFIVDNVRIEYSLMKRGKSADDAETEAREAAAEARVKAGDVSKIAPHGNLPDPAKVHIDLWKKLENGVSVWLVDGRLVRSVFDDDFTEGGHHHVYEYIPEREIWIDNASVEYERPYFLLHELHEYNLMEQGQSYEAAHADSSKIEKHMRKHPSQLHDALIKEGWALG